MAPRQQQVPENYFRHVSLFGFLLLPVTWILLPISAFAPHYLERFTAVGPLVKFIIQYQHIWVLLFKALCGIHLLEVLYAIVRCVQLGLTFSTTLNWIVNVALNGVFALRMLHSPEKADSKKRKHLKQ